MAVSLVQMTTTTSPVGLTGTGNEVVDAIYVAGATVAAGDWVVIDESVTTGAGAYKTCIQAPVSVALNPRVLGVAMTGGSSGDDIRVRRQGPIHPGQAEALSVNVADAAVAGDLLEMSAVAGRASVATAETERTIGVALAAADASNDCTWVDVRCL